LIYLLKLLKLLFYQVLKDLLEDLQNRRRFSLKVLKKLMRMKEYLLEQEADLLLLKDKVSVLYILKLVYKNDELFQK